MELLLWLYLYDNRWLFNLRLPTNIIKFLWAFPIFIHFMILSSGIYYLNFVDDYQCTKTLKMWIYHKTCFSILMIINIIIFLMKIQTLIQKEKLQIKESSKIFNYHPQNHLNSVSFDQSYLSFWVRRNSLISTSGILLLIQGFTSIYYSHLIKSIVTSKYFRSCDYKIQKALCIHSYSIFYGNLLILVIIVVMIIVKVFHFVMGMYFPRKYAYFMKFMSMIYKQKIFKFRLFGLLSLSKNNKNNSIEMRIIKDAVAYDKISLDNENFHYINKQKNSNVFVINSENDNIRVYSSSNLTRVNRNSSLGSLNGKNDLKNLWKYNFFINNDFASLIRTNIIQLRKLLKSWLDDFFME